MIVPAKQEADLARAVLSFLEAATRAVPLERTTALLATGRVREAMDRAVSAAEDALPTSVHRVAKAEVTLAEALARAFGSGADAGAAVVNFSLNMPDVAGAGWASREAASLVTGLTREARESIAAVVSEGLRTGVTPRQTAFMVQQVAGLSSAQAGAVSRYYTSFLQAAAAGQGAGSLAGRFTLAPRMVPNAAVADRAAERYAQRLRQQRALNIARTETQRAAHAGQLEAWQQLRDTGAFGNAHVIRQWITAEDERVCPTCGPMHLTQAELSGSYSLPLSGEAASAEQGGVVLHPPAHPSCRCDEVITLHDQARPARDATVGPRGESRRGPSVRNQPRGRSQPRRSQHEMTREEADAWAADSVIQEPMYHGVQTADEAESIRTSGFSLERQRNADHPLGDGVYVTRTERSAQRYAFGHDRAGQVLELRIRVERVATLDDVMTALHEKPPGVDAGLYIREWGKAQGYDAIEYAAMDELVIFDPRNIMIITRTG